ncbi:Zinc finger nuclear hormone receptor-type, partial [Trinorchestia longiramus]
APTSSRNILKICGVCGDRAKSMHFGGMACDSCKAFFRRSVQGKCWKEFQCLDEKSCTISKKNRKNCQYCRFAKCRSNGMDI